MNFTCDELIPPDLTTTLADGFEGPEKRLEVYFKRTINDPLGLRAKTQAEWQSLLDTAGCTIISATSNQFLDSYVLSESSLFVYPYKVILKTCGTITLLFCLDMLAEYAKSCNTGIQYLIFSRKNYNFPDKQIYPHKNFDTEVQFLNQIFSKGSPHVLGPDNTNGDYQLVYFMNNNITSVPEEETNRSSNHIEYYPTVEVMMSELDVEAMSNFYRNEKFVDSKTTTIKVGLADIFPHMQTDEFMFDPCGYSVNAISDANGSYFTVHVTPEPHCSYASFETNHPGFIENGLVEKVLKIFCPGRFSIVGSSIGAEGPKLPQKFEGFENKFRANNKFENGLLDYSLNLFQSEILSSILAG
jgi:S-adenosylmethionine decarboxylase